jgi:hypothetical protein
VGIREGSFFNEGDGEILKTFDNRIKLKVRMKSEEKEE